MERKPPGSGKGDVAKMLIYELRKAFAVMAWIAAASQLPCLAAAGSSIFFA